MSIIQALTLKVPALLLGPCIMLGAAAFAAIGIIVMRRFIHHSKLKTHNDVVDPILGAAVALYAVLTAFVVVMVWQNFDKSTANVQLEANYMADIYSDSEAFSPEFHNRIGALLREYREKVVALEWKAMARGEISMEVESVMNRIWSAFISYQPRNATEQAFFLESVSKLNSFRELRRQRIMDSRTGIPSLLWLVLIVGGVNTISLTFFFGVENMRVQLVISILLAVTISLALFTIMSLDYPFTGAVSVSSGPFKMMLLD
jgi:hypothetical protein